MHGLAAHSVDKRAARTQSHDDDQRVDSAAQLRYALNRNLTQTRIVSLLWSHISKCDEDVLYQSDCYGRATLMSEHVRMCS